MTMTRVTLPLLFAVVLLPGLMPACSCTNGNGEPPGAGNAHHRSEQAQPSYLNDSARRARNAAVPVNSRLLPLKFAML